MNDSLSKTAMSEGIQVDLLFTNEKPSFSDLFSIRGFEHPQFPASNRFDFAALAPLEFDQVDDY